MRHAELMAYMRATVWALRPDALRALLADMTDGSGQPPSAAAVRQTMTQGAVQIIPVMGPLSPRGGGLFEMFFGGVSVERLTAALRTALESAAISAIVLDVDSPGGSVTGIDELSTAIRAARGAKPIIAVANGQAASAAYWIASAADEMFVTPTGEVGSIGVWRAHVDYSAELAALGETVTLISAGQYKTEGNPYEPLGEEAHAYMQQRIDEYYDMFVRAVAANRGVAADVVSGPDYGAGRMLGAAAAKRAGMVDRIGTLDDAIARAATLARRPARAVNRADDDRTRAVLAGV